MKQLFTLKHFFLISVFISVFGYTKAQLPETPPVAWWSMAPVNGNDTIVVDNMGKYHGIMKEYEATDPTYADGKVGKALEFDGDTNHVVVNDTVPFMTDDGYSIGFWMYLDFNNGDVVWSFPVTTGDYQLANTCYIALNKQSDDVTKQWMRIYSWDKDLNSRIAHRKTDGDYADLFESKWRYITAVNEPDRLTLYIDGEVAATNSDDFTGVEFSRPFRFGKRDGNVNHFKGMIDEVRVYDYPLTQDQVKALMGITTQAQLHTREFKLKHYPNPFRETTNISFELKNAGKVSLEILNINGQVVKSLISSESRQAGSYKERWDCRSNDGTTQPAGLYLYRLKVNSETVGIGKMMLAK